MSHEVMTLALINSIEQIEWKTSEKFVIDNQFFIIFGIAARVGLQKLILTSPI